MRLATDSNSAISVCPIDQLQMVVSDTTARPSPSDPASYTFSGTAVTLISGTTDLTIAITNYSRPAGSWHVGNYYVTVTSSALNVTCQYQLQRVSVSLIALRLNQRTRQSVYASQPAYSTASPVPYNTSTSIGVRLQRNSGLYVLYVAVDNTPSPADPSTFLLAAVYNTTQGNDDHRVYDAQPIYVPAWACASATQAGQSCSVVLMGASSEWDGEVMWLKPSSSASAVWLYDNQTAYAPINATALATTYQFSLSASPLSVFITVNASSPVVILCSYQYVTPDAVLYDWQAVGDSDAYTNSTTQLNFTWNATLQTNPGTTIAAAPTTCYCTVQATTFDSYTIAYSATPLSSVTAASSRDGLSRGALAAVVVLPIVTVLALIGLLWWARRTGRLCNDGTDKGRTSTRLDETSSESGDVVMAELSVTRLSDGRLMRQQWQSDS